MEPEFTEIELNVIQEVIGMKELKYPLHYDPEKLKYNAKYKCFDFFASKFPDGWQTIPGFDKVIELCRKKAKTPLEEMNEKFATSIRKRREEEKYFFEENPGSNDFLICHTSVKISER